MKHCVPVSDLTVLVGVQFDTLKPLFTYVFKSIWIFEVVMLDTGMSP
jgi:hypothetical protein